VQHAVPSRISLGALSLRCLSALPDKTKIAVAYSPALETGQNYPAVPAAFTYVLAISDCAGHVKACSRVPLPDLPHSAWGRREILRRSPLRTFEVVLALIVAIVLFVVLKLIGFVIPIAIIGAGVGLIIGSALARAFPKD
jgi:hypothetical protein